MARKNAALLERPAIDGVPDGHVIVCAHKPLTVGVTTYQPGERIEGAEAWHRLEARLRARIVTTTTAALAKEHLHMTTREDVVAKMLTFDGYLNGAGYDCANRFSANLGRPPEAYCGDTMTDVFKLAGLPLPSMQLGCKTGFAYVPDAVEAARVKGAFKPSWEAEPADMACFDWNGDGIADHVEMVIHLVGGVLLSEGGNSGPSNVNDYKGVGGVHQHAWEITKDGNPLILGIIDTSKFVDFGSVATPPAKEPAPEAGPRLLMLKTPHMEGSDVGAVQRALNERGLRPELDVDNDFGPLTAQGVRWVETRAHIGVDSGVVGPQVRKVLGL
jgi:hypothetical protein